jgi:hypothetical protein
MLAVLFTLLQPGQYGKILHALGFPRSLITPEQIVGNPYVSPGCLIE